MQLLRFSQAEKICCFFYVFVVFFCLIFYSFIVIFHFLVIFFPNMSFEFAPSGQVHRQQRPSFFFLLLTIRGNLESSQVIWKWNRKKKLEYYGAESERS